MAGFAAFLGGVASLGTTQLVQKPARPEALPKRYFLFLFIFFSSTELRINCVHKFIFPIRSP